MITILWGAKGGSGTTFVATSLAQRIRGRTLLVDLDGDAARLLAVDQHERPGVVDWLTSNAPAEHLADVLLQISPDVAMLPAMTDGATTPAWRSRQFDRDEPIGEARWRELAGWCRAWADRPEQSVVIDAGTGEPPAGLVDGADRRLVVMRRCYLAAMRARDLTARPGGIVIVDEPGRTLDAADIAHAVGAPIAATVRCDDRIARTLDAGLLMSRPPRSRELARLAERS